MKLNTVNMVNKLSLILWEIKVVRVFFNMYFFFAAMLAVNFIVNLNCTQSRTTGIW